MTEFYLARHPETKHNVNRAIVSGRSNDIELTELGVQQAKQFATAYQANFGTPDALYSSPAHRAETMAHAFANETNFAGAVLLDDRLQEMSQGVAEGQHRELVYTPEVVATINQQLFDFSFPEGESLNDVSARMLEWLYETYEKHPNGTVLAISHGQAIRRLVGSLLNWNHFETTLDPSKITPNVSLTHITVDDTGATVHYMGKEIIPAQQRSTPPEKIIYHPPVNNQ